MLIRVTNDYFKYWNKILREFYRPLAISTTFNNHMFTYDGVSAGVIETQRVGYSAPDQQWLVGVGGRSKVLGHSLIINRGDRWLNQLSFNLWLNQVLNRSSR